MIYFLCPHLSTPREECDAFSLRSQQTWGVAAAAGHFTDEIVSYYCLDSSLAPLPQVPIMLKIKRKDVEFALDEHPKPKTTLEQLAKLPPVFKKVPPPVSTDVTRVSTTLTRVSTNTPASTFVPASTITPASTTLAPAFTTLTPASTTLTPAFTTLTPAPFTFTPATPGRSSNRRRCQWYL